MSLSDIDRILLQRCIEGAPRAWQDFADRFLGLVIHVANHTSESRGIKLDQATRDDLVAEVFLTLLASDRSVLRRFRRDSSLATYLTVIARRVIARRLAQSAVQSKLSVAGNEPIVKAAATDRIENREEVERLMTRLEPQEANVVRMYHLEGKSYHEISQEVGLAENSIGPLLTRARQKMREGA
ncbi:sigma-70 family RNA polymerase sigma factor [Stieleria sp. TO1_6]|uniref:RNA polymerase sigma factor n=1 Tax=Stieleria tagensis TaxID=2956795 RepID=UPI00209A76AE|nr:sigma-70 family RNA polymerase sigma factor [Stieleria tagensis]MCO8123409.1 sigma-70 family RNA polymerase sigma factor [Stieleria tagensis]